MDRWADDEDNVARTKKQVGRVAMLGMGGFVKSASAAVPASTDTAPQPVQIEVVASKKEQKQQAAAAAVAAMPPPQPRSRPPPTQPAPPPPPSLPEWVGGSVPPGACLHVYKDGVGVQEIWLEKAATLFGRLEQADVVLEHASVSRWHAAVCVKQGTEHVFVIDFGSAHGTFLNNIRVAKGCPVELTAGSTLRFGASTRKYVYELNPGVGGKRAMQELEAAEAQKRKKSRVRFGDEDGDEGSLSEVIGFSDGSSFTPLVGPKPVAVGQFADLLPSSSPADAHDRKPEGIGTQEKVKPELKSFLQNVKNLKARPTSLYDDL